MKMRFGPSMLVLLAMLIVPVLQAADAPENIEKYFEIAKDEKKADEAKKLGDTILKQLDKDSNELNEFAWKVLTEEGLKPRDLDLGTRVAKAAFDASEGKEAAIVDTYAKALFDSGKMKEGIEFQKKAVALCTDDNLKSELEETLKKYEEKIKEAKPVEKK